MVSFASDVYGRNPSPRRAQRMIGSLPVAASPTRVSTGIASSVTPPRVETKIAAMRPLAIADGYCAYVGQSFRFSSCECMCHFAEPNTPEPCDRAWMSGMTECSSGRR